MKTFKIGDRVRIASGRDEGETATVVQVDGREPALRVVYDEPQIRWVYTDQICRLKNEPVRKPRAQIGDTPGDSINEKAANFIRVSLATAGVAYKQIDVSGGLKPAPRVRSISLLVEEAVFNELNAIAEALSPGGGEEYGTN